MRILHVVPTYLPATRYGGPIYSVHGLCKALVDNGCDVHVYTTNVDGPGNSDVPLGQPVDMDGVSVWYFPSTVLRRLYWSPELRKKLDRSVTEFDMVHLHSVFLWPTWAAARAARKWHVPYTVSPRGMLVYDLVRRKNRLIKQLWIKAIEQKNLEAAAFVHVTAELEMRELSKFPVKLKHMVNIPNGVDEPQGNHAGGLNRDVDDAIGQSPYVLFLGRLSWKKGLDRLLSVWHKDLGYRLVIAGNDEENYLDELQEKYCLTEDNGIYVIPRGVDGNDKEALYENASLFVLPSYSENFGNTVLEAMMHGTPVLVTAEVGAAEVVEAAGAGMVVKADELQVALETMIDNPGELKAMGERGRKYVSQSYSWKAVATDMVDAYRSCLGENS